MAHFTCFFLFLIFVFSFVHHIFHIEEELLFKKLSFSYSSKSSSFVSNFKVNIASLNEKHRIYNKRNKEKFSDSEISLKLDKYNLRLNRHLKTLSYITMIEIKYQTNGKIEHLRELFSLKENIQREIIKITQKLNYYKSIKTNIL